MPGPVILLLALLLLAGCGSTSPVPMSDRSIKPAKKTVYIAGSGDTLYSIAFLSGLDYRELAAWNKIPDPYPVHRGQKISLVPPEGYSQPETAVAKTRPLQTPEPASGPNSVPVTVQSPPARPDSQSSSKMATVFNNTWKWPVASSNILSYKHSGQNDGLDINSIGGADVTASAAGKVVYAGNSLKGYGNLVIIKHSDTWLSAYAHNRSLTVAEGDVIAQGQKIAEAGNGAGAKPGLHFEIRKNGTPVNPLGLLPRKVG